MSIRLLVLGFGWAMIGGLYVLGQEHPVDVSPSTEAARGADAAGTPFQLVIPTIEVDAEIIPVGITPDKKMQIPKSAAKLGWFAPGARPGEQGNAVITGHVDSVLGTPGVFSRLHELTLGDLVRVIDHSGRTRAFRVIAIRTYDPFHAPMQEIFGTSDGYHLNLITCRGNWEIESGSYNERLVVFTEAVSPM